MPSRAQASPARARNWRATRIRWSSGCAKFTKLPIAVGFGVSTPEQFAEVGRFADAAVVGSAIVQRIEQNRGTEAAAVAEFLSSLTAARTTCRSEFVNEGHVHHRGTEYTEKTREKTSVFSVPLW